MKENIHDTVCYLLAAWGAYLAIHSPVAGASITGLSLAYGAGRIALERRDEKAARKVVEGLQHVVNANAQRLEEVILLAEKLNNDFHFGQTAKGLGLK